MKEIKSVRGWVEMDDNRNIVVGRLGLKVWKRKTDILQEGFHPKNIAHVVIQPMKYHHGTQQF